MGKIININEKFERWLIGKGFHEINDNFKGHLNTQAISLIEASEASATNFESSSAYTKVSTTSKDSSCKTNDAEETIWLKCLKNQRNYAISLFDLCEVPTLEVASNFFKKFQMNQAKLFNSGERAKLVRKKSEEELSTKLTRCEWRSQVKTMFDNLMLEARFSNVPSQKRRTKFKNRSHTLHLETEKSIIQLYKK